MGTHAQRIEALETATHENQTGVQAIIDQLAAVQLVVNKIAQDQATKNEDRRSDEGERSVNGRTRQPPPDDFDERDHQPFFGAKLARLEFPTFAGDDPTVWFSRVEQFFEFQAILEV
ncbi:unnamed protein product [Linum trigynum]|uniref:Uncharacterized protein n=1 Tax=Linum trigynum TaxID=586398 RepID=A0AAV2GTQ1_9ROSI